MKDKLGNTFIQISRFPRFNDVRNSKFLGNNHGGTDNLSKLPNY